MDYDVYMGRIDNIGYDAANRITPSKEVSKTISEFHKKTKW